MNGRMSKKIKKYANKKTIGEKAYVTRKFYRRLKKLYTSNKIRWNTL